MCFAAFKALVFLTSVMANLKFIGIDPFTLPPATACGEFISEGNWHFFES